jgi:hypothetical protein
MKHYSGAYFCTDSNWNGEYYDANNVVTINNHSEEYSTYDFTNLVDVTENETAWSPHDHDRIHEYYYLKSHVIRWLIDNIKPDTDGGVGWCCGSKEYGGRGRGVSVWFYRRSDAQLFIRTFSEYKKPTGYYNQNSYIRKKLNLETNTLQPC